MRLISMLVLIAAMALPNVAGAQPLVLVKDGKPAAAIVIGKQATRAAQFAAFELQWHIKEMTGATVPIVNDEAAAEGVQILVGESAKTQSLGLRADGFKSQEYLVRFGRDTIVLMGRDKADTGQVRYDLMADPDGAFFSWPYMWDERGTLNACYDFLEEFCGVRWFNPTEFGMDCPKTTTLAISGQNIRRAPAFDYRDVTGAIGEVAEQYDAYVALWPESAMEFKAYEAAAYPNLHAKFPDGRYRFAKRAWVRLFQLRRREGGALARCNHSLAGYYYRFWEKNPACPDLFVEKKPDWFAQGYDGIPPQMCYTNEGLIQQLAQDARDYFDGRKTGTDLGIFWQPKPPNPFPVEPMDNGSFCKCERCQVFQRKTTGSSRLFSNGQQSDYFFHFVNAVAKEVRKTHPTETVVTLAYMSHAAPPKSFALEPNVAVEFCFAANRLPYLGDYRNEIGLLQQWAKLRQGRPLYLWLYDTFPVEVATNGKFHCFPGFFAHLIGEQFKLFHRLGVRGMFHCGYGQDVEAYVTYKLMDNPTLDVEVLLDDYFRRLYGPAGEPLKKMYSLIEQTYGDPGNYSKEDGHQTMLIAWGKLGTPERMAQLGAWMEQAKALAATEVQKKRVALFEQSVWNYMVAGRKQYLERTATPLPSAKVPRVSTANGDVAKLDWTKAAVLAPWHVQGLNKPAARQLTARALHDGQFLYLELMDPCDTAKLQTAGAVFPYDDWELFVASQRALPYRQFAVSPSGHLVALSHGEVNFRMNVPIERHGVRVVSDIAAPGRWVTRLALPLASLTPLGVPAGGRFYLNLARVSSPQVTGSGVGTDAWVAFSKGHEVDRLAEVTLE